MAFSKKGFFCDRYYKSISTIFLRTKAAKLIFFLHLLHRIFWVGGCSGKSRISPWTIYFSSWKIPCCWIYFLCYKTSHMICFLYLIHIRDLYHVFWLFISLWSSKKFFKILCDVALNNINYFTKNIPWHCSLIFILKTVIFFNIHICMQLHY